MDEMRNEIDQLLDELMGKHDLYGLTMVRSVLRGYTRKAKR